MITTLLLLSGLSSPFPSTVPGITIPNAHLMDQKSILRGSQPASKVSELSAWGVTDVIIFKNQTGNEVDKELAALQKAGITSHHIPFRWKELESPEVACRQVVDALKIIRDGRLQGKVTYFHCTVGEDRTGLLAGVWRRLDENLSDAHAWQDEMCAHGYADGNPGKQVSTAIHAELTPLYTALSSMITKGDLNLLTLDPEVCKGLVFSPVKRLCKK